MNRMFFRSMKVWIAATVLCCARAGRHGDRGACHLIDVVLSVLSRNAGASAGVGAFPPRAGCEGQRHRMRAMPHSEHQHRPYAVGQNVAGDQRLVGTRHDGRQRDAQPGVEIRPEARRFSR